jgi:hypothetical protein
MLLRVPPFRGAQVGTGAVVLTTLVALLQLRMGGWSAGAHLACAAGLGAIVWTLVIGTPPAEGQARPWLAALCLSAVLLLVLALGRIVELAGDDGFFGIDGGSGAGLALSAPVVCLAAAWCARRRNVASCALVAGVAGTGGLVALASWIGDPSLATIRWLLALAAFVLLVLTLVARDNRPEHGAQLANAGGLAVAAIGQTAGFGPLGLFFLVPEGTRLGTGWELVVLAAGFGLMAYGAVDGHRGPVVLGISNVAIFVAAASLTGGFAGWPVVLLVAGVGLLAVGLRPTTPAPPEPGSDADPPPAIEVRVES